MEIRFNNPRETSINPLNVGMIWLNFQNSNNFFKLSVVNPTIINGITCPSPKKNKNISDIKGFFACETHARSVANTGVIHGEDASPKAAPVTIGARNGGTLFSINLKSGLLGSWNLIKPSKFNPIIIAKMEILVVKIWGN